MARFVLLCVAVCAGVALACQPPDCDTPDCGSCSNACCLIEFKFAKGPTDTYQTIVGSLKAGGADGRYRFINGSDYRKAGRASGVQYQLQGVHSTLVHHYNDTLNMIVLSNSSDSSVVRAFSISQIEGALCDAGQNYKNLVGFIKGLSQSYAKRIVFGCTMTL